MAPQIVVHWLEDSRAQRILWLLEELGLAYEGAHTFAAVLPSKRARKLTLVCPHIHLALEPLSADLSCACPIAVKHYKRDATTNLAPKELRDVHPLGKSPVVVITDNGTSITLAESGAIVEFLIERYGDRLSVPASSSDLQARADYLYWLHFAEGSAMGPLMFALVFTAIPKQAPWVARPLVSAIANGAMSQFVIPRLKETFRFIEGSLEGKEYFAGGKLTGADIMMSFIAEGLAATPLDAAKYPNLARWHAALQQRPGYIEAEKRGGKNNLDRFLK